MGALSITISGTGGFLAKNLRTKPALTRIFTLSSLSSLSLRPLRPLRLIKKNLIRKSNKIAIGGADSVYQLSIWKKKSDEIILKKILDCCVCFVLFNYSQYYADSRYGKISQLSSCSSAL